LGVSTHQSGLVCCRRFLQRPRDFSGFLRFMLELVNLERQAANEAAKADEQAAEKEPEPEGPENLMPTETRTRPQDLWDIPDVMAALFQEGCKQVPGHSADMMRDFARQFVWTAAMVKGLIASMAESRDGEDAEATLQENKRVQSFLTI
jgi:hypothetical protein